MHDRDFYLRLYIGRSPNRPNHQWAEFMEFELAGDGELRYTNQSAYRGEAAIRKRAFVTRAVLRQAARIVEEAGLMALDDGRWPRPDKDGLQELEVRIAGGGLGGGDEGGGGGDGGGAGGDGNGDGDGPPPPARGAPAQHVSFATTKLSSTVQVARCPDAAGLRRYYYACQDLKALFLALVGAHFQVQPI